MTNRGFLFGIFAWLIGSLVSAIFLAAIVIVSGGLFGNALRHLANHGTIVYGEIVEFSPYTETSKYDGKTIH